MVISNESGAKGLVRAQGAGLGAEVIDHRAYDDRPSFEKALTTSLRKADVELVCLAGFMRIVTRVFVEHWHDRLINIHPSLLPAFKGLDVHERVIRSGARFSGCTVHFVRADMDVGPIIVQAVVPVRVGDTAAELAARVLASEHRCLPLAIRWISEGRVRVLEDVVTIDGADGPTEGLINPSEMI